MMVVFQYRLSLYGQVLLLTLLVCVSFCEEAIVEPLLNSNSGFQTSSSLLSLDDVVNDDDDSISTMTDEISRAGSSNSRRQARVGLLRPSNLPDPEIFNDWNPVVNQTVSLEVDDGKIVNLAYASGLVSQKFQTTTTTKTANKNDEEAAPQSATLLSELAKLALTDDFAQAKHLSGDPNKKQVDVSFAVVPGLMKRQEVDAVLHLLRTYHKDLDDDPDTVDGMPSYEIFVTNPDMEAESDRVSIKHRDYHDKDDRTILRTKLKEILDPIITERITPFIQWRYPDKCQSNDPSKACKACYSLIRRYRFGERVSHAPHHDGHALVTAVTSLSDYEKDYRGGLYVVSPNSLPTKDNNSTTVSNHHKVKSNAKYLGLHAGDTAIHTSALLHGVKVYPKKSNKKSTERWSWILWYRDSGDNCHNDNSITWFNECAIAGDAICQQLHSMKVGSKSEVVYWNLIAAENGAGTAAVKIARAYLGSLDSPLKINRTFAMQYYQMAINAHDNPEGHYGVAQLLIQSVAIKQKKKLVQYQKNIITQQEWQSFEKWKNQQLQIAIHHLEKAAVAGHVFSMFNLGIAHTFGYGILNEKNEPVIDTKIAAEWFIESGLPEGYFTAAHYYSSVNNQAKYEECMERAKILGHFAPWRQQARIQTGSGGIGNIELNIDWPLAHDGRQPPRF